jgi:hypothetical protein
VSRFLVKLSWGALIATVLVALALAVFLLWGLPELLPAGSAITIDGDRFEITNITPTSPGQWVMASIGVVIAAAVLVVVVPIVVVLVVGIPLIAAAFGTALGFLALALMASPLILLVWWLWKDPKKKASGAKTIGA